MAASKKKKASKAKKKTASKRKKTAARKARSRPAPGKLAGSGREDAGRVGEIQRLIDVMVEAGAVEVETEEKGRRLRVRLKEDQPLAVMPYGAPPTAVAGPIGSPESAATQSTSPSTVSDGETFVFNSPMVGTFYTAPSPETEAFVRVGQEVTPDTTLCILEAMKVMNEIKAEVDGVIVEILAENGESIEFGQPLFVLRNV